jgi:hypothetical protein
MSRASTLFSVLVGLNLLLDPANLTLTHSRAQNRQLQRALRHDRLVLVLDGLRERSNDLPQADPVFLIYFPDIDYKFEIFLLEDSNTIKLSLHHGEGVWCEEIVIPELKLLSKEDQNDHLVLELDQVTIRVIKCFK